MDLTRKADGTSATNAAEACSAFIEDCTSKGISISIDAKRKLNSEFRSLYKKMGKKLSELDFEEIVASLTITIPEIEDYITRAQAAEFLADVQSLAPDVTENPETPVIEKAPDNLDSAATTDISLALSPEAENLSETDNSSEGAAHKETSEPMEQESSSVTATINESPKPTEKPAVSDTTPKTTKQAKALEKLDLIYGMRGSKKVDAKRKKEITKEIHSLKVLRNSATRPISMRSDDMAIFTSIMAYASSKDGAEKQFRDCDMDSWTGIMHAAAECLLEKIAEEGRTTYLDVIVKGLDAEAKRKSELDARIDRLVAEKEGV